MDPRDYSDDIKQIEKEFKIAELKRAGFNIEDLLKAGQKKKLKEAVFEFTRKAMPDLPPEIKFKI